jgi:sarcosine oxidase, subunit gamma
MLETLQRPPLPRTVSTSHAGAVQSLLAGWREELSIVNLRGNAADPVFTRTVSNALDLELPVRPCSSVADSVHRVVWAGPDDWFVMGPRGQASAIGQRLGGALGSMHHAVTDVSSGYTVLSLSGPPVRDVLAQGCPLDLHPRVFRPGDSAGSVFFKASVWLWQVDDAPTYEMLVRSSFMGYAWLMLERCTQECGLVTRRFR